MAYRPPAVYADYKTDVGPPRNGQARAPLAVHQYPRNAVNTTRRPSDDPASATVPRSQRRSEARYHDDARSGGGTRSDVRYGGSGQQNYDSSRHTSAPSAGQHSDRSYEDSRNDRRPTHRPGYSEDLDETGSAHTSSTGARGTRDNDDGSVIPNTHHPSKTHRTSQVSFEIDANPRHYAHNARGRHDDGYKGDYDAEEDTSPTLDRRDSYGRTERKRPTHGEERPSTARQHSGQSITPPKSYPENEPGSDDDVSRSSARNKRYHQEPSRGRLASPSRHHGVDAPTERHQKSGVQPSARDDYSSRSSENYDRRHPLPSTTSKAQKTSIQENRSQGVADDTEHVWQPWERAKDGRRYRVALFEGKTKLIQLDNASGPYCGADRKPIPTDRALEALKFISDRTKKSGSGKPNVRTHSPNKASDKQTRGSRDDFESDSEDTETPSRRESDRRGRHSHRSRKDHRHGDRDEGVDRLGHALASTALRTGEEPRRPMMFRRAMGDDHASGAPGATRPKGPPRPRPKPKDDDDFDTGTYGARMQRTKPRGGDDHDTGTFGTRIQR